MKQVTVNNALSLSYPESYRDMTEDELKHYFGTAENRWGVHDDERHAILTVSWRKAGILSFLTDAESMLIGVEARYKRNLINYRRLTSFKTKIGKAKGHGIRFEYRVNNANIYQNSELRAIKCKGRFYAFQYIGRRISDDQTHPDFDQMMESVSFK